MMTMCKRKKQYMSAVNNTHFWTVYEQLFRAVRDYYVLVAAIYNFSNLANLAVYKLPNQLTVYIDLNTYRDDYNIIIINRI